MVKTILLLLSCVAALLCLPGTASAHALGAEWSIRGGQILLEAYFSDDTPAQGAVVSVLLLSTEPAKKFEGKTDEKGFCLFPRPGRPGKYRIVVDAGSGHKKELIMEIRTRPETIPGIALACGLPSLGGLGNLAIVPLLAEETEPIIGFCPRRQEFTAYPWHSLLTGFAIIGAAAAVLWMVVKRRAH